MTKRDYELIAEVLAGAKPTDATALSYDDRMVVWTSVVRGFTSRLSAENPRFDDAKFCKACGMK